MTGKTYKTLSFTEKCDVVKNMKPGEVWMREKSSRKVTITSVTRFEVKFTRENGQVGVKQPHYFASDYIPVETNPTFLEIELPVRARAASFGSTMWFITDNKGRDIARIVPSGDEKTARKLAELINQNQTK